MHFFMIKEKLEPLKMNRDKLNPCVICVIICKPHEIYKLHYLKNISKRFKLGSI